MNCIDKREYGMKESGHLAFFAPVHAWNEKWMTMSVPQE
jgi:hypothetical protein